MKKLANVSPFLLLLFPVFIMMFFAFATSNDTQDEEVVKTSAPTSTTIVKATAAILK